MEFSYRATTKEGKVIDGVVTAPDENNAVSVLHGKGYIVLTINEIDQGLMAIDVNKFLAHIKTKDIVVFTRQLATLVDADMPITESLRTLSKQVENPKFREVIADVVESVEGGSSLSTALAIHPEVFSPFYIKLIQSGEVSGKLHDSLLYLADYLERSQSLNSKLKGALAYPAFILFSLVVVGAIMALYVLPQLLSIFKETGVTDLPFTTKILIWATDFINNNLIFIILVLIGSSGAGGYYLFTEEGKNWFDSTMIGMPGLGKVVRNLYLARIAESLATLIKSGIPILESMKITGELVGNRTYRSIMKDAEETVKGGGKMSDSFLKFEEMPVLFSSMVAIGEKTGKLDFILGHISKFYKEESENSVQAISQIIEPALVLLLGAAVAIMVSSILLPIYNLVGSI